MLRISHSSNLRRMLRVGSPAALRFDSLEEIYQFGESFIRFRKVM
jgi:hypothetical protein